MNPLLDPTPRGNQNSVTGFCRELDAAGRALAWKQLVENVLELREAAIAAGYEPTQYPPATAFVRSMCRRPVSLLDLEGRIVVIDADRFANIHV